MRGAGGSRDHLKGEETEDRGKKVAKRPNALGQRR